MTPRIEKSLHLNAPVRRVWTALTDSAEFCLWFHASLDGPFVPGRTVYGHSTYPGHEEARFAITVQRLEPERAFSFSWPAYADCAEEACHVLVEFMLEPMPSGTRLTMTGSGYERLPAARREAVFADHSGGWTIQMANIAAHVSAAAQDLP